MNGVGGWLCAAPCSRYPASEGHPGHCLWWYTLPVSDQWSLPCCGCRCSFIHSKICLSNLMLNSLFFNVYLFWLCHVACRTLVPRPEIEPTPHAVEARSPNHWTTREVPEFIFSIRCPIPQVPWWLSGRESTCQFRRHRFDPWVGKIPWRRKWQPILVFLPGKSHGQRSLAGYSLWGCRVGHDLTTKQQHPHTCPFLPSIRP